MCPHRDVTAPPPMGGMEVGAACSIHLSKGLTSPKDSSPLQRTHLSKSSPLQFIPAATLDLEWLKLVPGRGYQLVFQFVVVGGWGFGWEGGKCKRKGYYCGANKARPHCTKFGQVPFSSIFLGTLPAVVLPSHPWKQGPPGSLGRYPHFSSLQSPNRGLGSTNEPFIGKVKTYKDKAVT